MPYTYEKDKNGRWRARGDAAGSVPMSGGGFGPAKPTPKRKEPEGKPWWWHITPQGLGNDLKYEAKRAQEFNKPRPTDRKPTLPIQQLIYALPPVARQVVAGATVRAGSDAALAAVNLGQRAWGNYNRIKNPLLKAAVGATGVVTLPALGLFGPSRDPESTSAGKAILAASRAATKALGARLPEEMSPSDRDVYEAIPAGVAANAALAPVGALQVGRAIKGAGVAAKVARWGANTAANEVAANLVTDNTMGGPSSLLKAVGVPVPDALSADPARDDRISAAIRETPASILFAGALGGAAGLLERLPHVARALRENRTAQELNKARQKTVANGLQEPDPTTGGHNFTQTATTPPPPPPAPVAPAPAKPFRSFLEQDAEMLGITPEELAASRGVPYSSTSQPAPAAAPAPAAEPRAIPSIEGGDFTTFGKAEPGDLPQADPAVSPWATTPAPEAPAAAAAPAPMAAPEPAAPKAPAAADDMAAPVYDPELPEIDHVALALERLDPAAVEQIAQTPGPVLPRIEEALANRQPVAPRPELTAGNVVAPTEKLAENQFLTRRDEWTNLRDDELLGVFHPEVNPGLFAEAHARTGRSFEELTRQDALETLSALADGGATVMPDRLKAGIELARTADLVADPERFQYKLNTDRRGVQKGNSLEGLDRWNTSMEGALLVWEDPATGKTYVVNGHNRLAKALQLGIPTVPVKRLLANTPEQARALGAMDNIASGGGTPWDAAKFFRDAGILDMDQAGKAGLPLNSGHAEKGLQLAALPDNIFQAGLTGELKEARALELGGSGLSPEKMQSVWNEYQADKFFQTEEGFRDLIDLARDTPTTKDQTGRIVQDSLPGLETAAERDLTKTKLKLARKVAGNLRTDKNALRGAARNVTTLEAKGNSKIDANASMQAGLETAQLADVFNALKFKADNDISRLLNEGAAEIAAGAKADMVARRIQGELAQAAEGVVMPAKAPEPVAPVAPEPPMPKTAQDHEANQMLVLNRAAAQNEVRPSATPIPVPPAPPEIDVAKAAKGIDAQDVMGGDSQLKFAQQQRQQALDAGDTKAVEAWDKEIRKVNQGRLGAAMDAQDASQTGLFGVTEYDNSMPLFDQSKLDAEEARLAAEYKVRDTAMQQEVARAEREAMGYHDMTFEQKKAEAGIAEGWAPKELPPATSKAGKDLAKEFKRLEGILEWNKTRLPAAKAAQEKELAKGKAIDPESDLVAQIIKQNEMAQRELAKLRAEYGIEAPEGAGKDLSPAGWDSVGGNDKSDNRIAAEKQVLTGIIKKVAGDDVAIRFSDVYDVQIKPPEWGGNGVDTILVGGHYDPKIDFIQINALGTKSLEQLIETSFHESFHRIQWVALSGKEIDVLDGLFARLKVDLGARKDGISYSESQAVAYQRYARARFLGDDPIAALLGTDRASLGRTPTRLEKTLTGIISAFDKIADFVERTVNLVQGNGFDSAKGILERAYGGSLRDAKHDLATLNRGAMGKWKIENAPGQLLKDLSVVLRDVDGGKLKGVSKKALDAAEKGDPEQALAEATDYAKRRLAEIDNKIESIKQRAIKEGC